MGEFGFHGRILPYFLLLLVLTGCSGGLSSSRLAVPPTVIHEGVHNGGSALAFNPEGTLLASGGWEGKVHLWGLPDGARRTSWQAHDGTVNGLAFLGAGEVLISAGYDRRLVLWDRDGKILKVVVTDSPITSLAVAAERNLIATGHDDGQVKVWRLQDNRVPERIAHKRLHKDRVRGLAWHPVRTELASSGKDGRVMQWMIHEGVVELPRPSSYARSLVYTHDGRVLVGSGWFRLFRWELDQRKLRELSTAHRGIINSIALEGGGRYVASISRQTDSAVHLLNPDTGELIQRMQRHELCGGFVALSPDGHFLATTGDDASVRIWNLGQPRRMSERYNR